MVLPLVALEVLQVWHRVLNLVLLSQPELEPSASAPALVLLSALRLALLSESAVARPPKTPAKNPAETPAAPKPKKEIRYSPGGYRLYDRDDPRYYDSFRARFGLPPLDHSGLDLDD